MRLGLTIAAAALLFASSAGAQTYLDSGGASVAGAVPLAKGVASCGGESFVCTNGSAPPTGGNTALAYVLKAF
jgi:hypothetical protein